jgi:hypothetical protein
MRRLRSFILSLVVALVGFASGIALAAGDLDLQCDDKGGLFTGFLSYSGPTEAPDVDSAQQLAQGLGVEVEKVAEVNGESVFMSNDRKVLMFAHDGRVDRLAWCDELGPMPEQAET